MFVGMLVSQVYRVFELLEFAQECCGGAIRDVR